MTSHTRHIQSSRNEEQVTAPLRHAFGAEVDDRLPDAFASLLDRLREATSGDAKACGAPDDR